MGMAYYGDPASNTAITIVSLTGVYSWDSTAVMANHSTQEPKPQPPSLRRLIVEGMLTGGLVKEARQRDIDRRNYYAKQKLRETLGPRGARWR